MKTSIVHVRRTDENGFSIIELLVAMAIVAIVGMIAQPMFHNYSARARQVEAKYALSSIYAAERSFQSENGFYSACLSELGFGTTNARRYYSIGFTNKFIGFDQDPMQSYFPSCNTKDGEVANDTFIQANYFEPPVAGATSLATSSDIPPNSYVAQDRFMVFAVGHIGLSGGAYDYWSIDENRYLLVTNSQGLPASGAPPSHRM